MQNFQRLLESPMNWVMDFIDAGMRRYRRSVERRRQDELRRRYMNG
ncbi:MULTISPECIES: hypothetical protein [unclassified Rhizobium]|jgi:hypothetical protein